MLESECKLLIAQKKVQINLNTYLIYGNETCTLGQKVGKRTTSVGAIFWKNEGIHYYKFIGSKLMPCMFGGQRIDDYTIKIHD